MILLIETINIKPSKFNPDSNGLLVLAFQWVRPDRRYTSGYRPDHAFPAWFCEP
jgi:hypothetical protein